MNASSLDNYLVNPVQTQHVQVVFYVIYSLIFVIGVSGNALVAYVVLRKPSMRTVTNYFITNLAFADVLLCILCVPFTPLYTFLGHWVFGQFMCHLVTCAQGISVYISSLTLTTIALDRFYVMMYPFKTRMSESMCAGLILTTWFFSIAATVPYAYFVEHISIGHNRYICQESFPEGVRVVYGSITAVLQFVVPFTIMVIAYTAISFKLTERAQNRPGLRSVSQEQEQVQRTRRTNWMLVAMVTVFGTAWLPLNLLNLLDDISSSLELSWANWRYFHLLFFMAHAFAMSSTCYNPFLYAWLNEAFRKEFREILPCICLNQDQTHNERLLEMKEMKKNTRSSTKSLGGNRQHSGQEVTHTIKYDEKTVLLQLPKKTCVKTSDSTSANNVIVEVDRKDIV